MGPHARQKDAAGGLNVSRPHGEQEAAPVSAKRPAAHGAQSSSDATPVTPFVDVPLGHRRHADGRNALTSGLYEPAGHAVLVPTGAVAVQK